VPRIGTTLLFAPQVLVALLLCASATAADRNSETTARPDQDFALKDLNGKVVHFSDFRGKAVVLNFWATWCPPCREEIPWFVALQKQYGPEGLQFVGISMDEGDAKAIASFVAKMRINYPILLGAGEIHGVQALPMTLYFGRDGRVLKLVPGLMDRDEVEKTIREALAPAAPDDEQDDEQPSTFQRVSRTGR